MSSLSQIPSSSALKNRFLEILNVNEFTIVSVFFFYINLLQYSYNFDCVCHLQASMDQLSRTSLFSEISDLSITGVDDSDQYKKLDAGTPKIVSLT